MGNDNTIRMAQKAAALTNPTSASTFVRADDSTKPACVYFPVIPSYVTAVQKFKFRAVGQATTVGSHNVTPKVDYGVSVTAGSNTAIAAATARACATTTASWSIEGDLYWNPTSQALTGRFTALNGSTAVLDAYAVTTAVASVDLTTSGKGLTVECTIATGGGDTATLDELSLEQV